MKCRTLLTMALPLSAMDGCREARMRVGFEEPRTTVTVGRPAESRNMGLRKYDAANRSSPDCSLKDASLSDRLRRPRSGDCCRSC